ncbi:hypothetical protein ACFYV7_12255 [Nocardia suismassiliense]|uniref:Uncharacterized protein n=1 Tax=Nocardia suismassiliense TaxID=2077092 RepID=A0ABW6QQQ7_9NOCA
MGRFSAQLRTDLEWIKSNAESVVAVALAVTMSVLGLVDVIPTDLVSKVIPLTLGVVAYAMLRDRWRQESVNTEIRQTITEVAGTLRDLHERVATLTPVEGVLERTQRTLDDLAAVRFAVGTEVSEALTKARQGTERWTFKGGTGAHTRVVTLPDCLKQAHHDGRDFHARIEILDPTDLDVCQRYAALYRTLAEGENDDALTWTGKGTQIELYATILAVCWYKQRLRQFLDIEIALTSSVSMFRWDMSSRYLIVTQRGPRFPAMIVQRGQPYYDSWRTELQTSFHECRRVPIERAPRVPLDQEPTVAEVRTLFEVLGLDIPDDYDDADVQVIIEKALRDSNPFLRGAGDNLARGVA